MLPLLQSYAYLSLEPMRNELELTDLGRQLVFTVAIGTEPEQMDRAAERLLGLTQDQISLMARDIVTEEVRRAMATLKRQGNEGDTEALISDVVRQSEPALRKLGLVLTNAGFPL